MNPTEFDYACDDTALALLCMEPIAAERPEHNALDLGRVCIELGIRDEETLRAALDNFVSACHCDGASDDLKRSCPMHGGSFE